MSKIETLLIYLLIFQNGIFGVSGKHLVLLSRLQGALGMPGGGITVFVTVTQVAGDVGRFTPVEPVINYLKYHNVKLGLEIPKLINFFSGLASKVFHFLNCPETRNARDFLG